MTGNAIAQFCDVLLPGGEGWASASAALEIPALVAALAEDDRTWLHAQATRMAGLAPEHRAAAMVTLEQQQPTPFARVLTALYRAYYATPAAHDSVRHLAESGPREASPYFDETLLRQMRETQAGRRRF